MPKEMRKLTVILPKDLIDGVIKASGLGITSTIRKALEAGAASHAN